MSDDLKKAAQILELVNQIFTCRPTDEFKKWFRRALFELVVKDNEHPMCEGLRYHFDSKVEEFGLGPIVEAIKGDPRFLGFRIGFRSLDETQRRKISKLYQYNHFAFATNAEGQWEAWLCDRDVVGEKIEKIFGLDLPENLEKNLRKLFDG